MHSAEWLLAMRSDTRCLESNDRPQSATIIERGGYSSCPPWHGRLENSAYDAVLRPTDADAETENCAAID